MTDAHVQFLMHEKHLKSFLFPGTGCLSFTDQTSDSIQFVILGEAIGESSLELNYECWIHSCRLFVLRHSAPDCFQNHGILVKVC